MLTIFGRVASFESFIKRWELLAHNDQKLGLFVSIFETEKYGANELIEEVRRLKEKVPNRLVEYKAGVDIQKW